MNDIAISLKNVGKKYQLIEEKRTLFKSVLVPTKKPKDVWALKNINLEIKKGDTIGIIGENGSGKSTLLKLIAGIASPTNGLVQTQGKLGSLIELGAGFHQDLTGRENVYLNGALLGFTKAQLDEKYKNILSFADIGKYINQPVRTFSSGMVVRLGFAVAIHMDPEILLIDEVLAVGDEEFQKKCIKILDSLHKKSKTIIFVSHNLSFIEYFSDRAYLLSRGKGLAEGNPQTIVSKYQEYLSKNKIISINKSRNTYSNEIEILSLGMYGKDGKIKKLFNSGDEIKFVISYKQHAEIDNPVFNIQIIRNDGVFCFGDNTERQNIKLNRLKMRGKILLKIDKLNLLRGEYFISVRVLRKNLFLMDVIDEKENISKIVVNSDINQGGGIVKMSSKWIIN